MSYRSSEATFQGSDDGSKKVEAQSAPYFPPYHPQDVVTAPLPQLNDQKDEKRGWTIFGRKKAASPAFDASAPVIPPVAADISAHGGRMPPVAPVSRKASVSGNPSSGTSSQDSLPRELKMLSRGVANPTPFEQSKSRAMEEFFKQLSDIQDTVSLIDDQVNAISTLHANSLENADEVSAHMAEQEVTHVQSLTRSLMNAVKHKLLTMFRTAQLCHHAGDRNTQLSQINALKNRFKGVVQRYHEMEQVYRSKYRARAERQYRVVNPNATPEEISAVLNDERNGQQVFQAAMRSCSRPGEARTALREVQERHEDIRKIEKNIAELAALYADIDLLLTEQGDQVTAIFNTTDATKAEMKEAKEFLAQGVVHARNARRKRWCLFGLLLAIIILIVIVVAASVCGGGKCSRHLAADPQNKAINFGQPQSTAVAGQPASASPSSKPKPPKATSPTSATSPASSSDDSPADLDDDDEYEEYGSDAPAPKTDHKHKSKKTRPAPAAEVVDANDEDDDDGEDYEEFGRRSLTFDRAELLNYYVARGLQNDFSLDMMY